MQTELITRRRVYRRRLLQAGAVGALIVVGLALIGLGRDSSEIGWAGTAVLGLVEGVTEYLPVSSTGHLAVASLLVWPDAGSTQRAALDSYVIVIQAGAIAAVVGLYWRRFVDAVAGVAHRGPGRRLAVGLVVGFVPAAVTGLLLGALVKERLFGLAPIAWAWVVGGVIILLVERHPWRDDGADLEDLQPKQAGLIGWAQVLALWPGTSRSLVTILGGRAAGLSTGAAVEFSFLLGAVTLFAASAYEAVGNLDSIGSTIGVGPALVGFVVATASAAVVAKWLVAFLARHSLAVFGWYRILLGIAALLFLEPPPVSRSVLVC